METKRLPVIGCFGGAGNLTVMQGFERIMAMACELDEATAKLMDTRNEFAARIKAAVERRRPRRRRTEATGESQSFGQRLAAACKRQAQGRRITRRE